MALFNKRDPMNDLPPDDAGGDDSLGSVRYLIFLGVLVILIIFLGLGFLYLRSIDHSTPPPKDPGSNEGEAGEKATSTEWKGLPKGELGIMNGNLSSSSLLGLGVENLSFGNFYDPIKSDYEKQIETYELPINVKVDVSNYYDVSRKIDLDPYLQDLNDRGFSIMKNSDLPKAAGTDFFSVNRYLLDKDIPVVVTNDFLFYYFQNYIKKTYKEIEQGAFYRNLWDINEDLYNIALTRYKQTKTEKGLVNDPVLEGQRLALAYFAVGLELLSPTEDQVVSKSELTDGGKFNENEASAYSFRLPDFLKEDIREEVEQIRKASGENKSSLFLYSRDYSDFKIPTDYRDNDKLNNFYLATKWLNSVFPLNYKSPECENCLLDYNDWTINMIGAGYLAQDLYTNKDIKAKWAVIYKFISFFTGLRQDLTYLHYYDVYSDLFGEEFDLAEIYGTQEKRRENLGKVRSRLADYDFLPMEGAIARSNPENKPIIGMRMLQEGYWPNDYIYKRLTGEDLFIQNEDARQRFTACKDRQGNAVYRCRGIGLDIANLIHPVKFDSEYFLQNTGYTNYPERISELRGELGKFDKHTWNKNVYWFTLDIAGKILSEKGKQFPVFMQGDAWQQNKDVNTALGGWVNLHLPDDRFLNYSKTENTGFNNEIGYNKYNYVEPDVEFVNELIAKNKMLLDMMGALNVTSEARAAAVRLQQINKQLERIADISRKELSSESLNEIDHKFITDFIKRYTVEERGGNEFRVKIGDSKSLKANIDGMRLLLIVYKHKGDGKKILAAGPIFNYEER